MEKTSSMFTRTDNALPSNDRYFIMQYLGDVTAYVLTTHGNLSSDFTKVYTRTCPSVIIFDKTGI